MDERPINEFAVDVLIDLKIVDVDVDSYINFICSCYKSKDNYQCIRTYILMDILKPCLDENGEVNPDVFHVLCNLYIHPNFNNPEVKKEMIRIDRKLKLNRIKNK